MIPWHNDLAETLALDGAWQFALGDQQGTIQVPGSWEAQGYAHRLEGPATYRRTMHIPAEWRGRRVHLQCDAVSYYAEVTVNGQPVGTHTGSWTAFDLDITAALRPGEENTIALEVWKPGERFPLRESLAGFLPDVFVMFGGLWQSARLLAHSGPALSDIRVLPEVASGTVRVSAEVHTAAGAAGLTAVVAIHTADGRTVTEWRGPVTGEAFSATLSVPDPALWGPDHPALYTAELRLEDAQGVQARAVRRFGFRALTHAGEQLLFNGVPVMLRGALNWGWYPDILCPAPDEATIRDEFRRIRALGFNLMKLCLYVPSPRYFEIADEEGIFLWLELPLWLPQVTPRLEQQALIEYAEIVSAAQHHPSIVIYSLGCELEANVSPAWLEDLNATVRSRLSDVLLCDNSGSGEAYGCAADLADFEDYHFYCDMQFFEPLVDHFHRDWRTPRPLIFGEFCDADDYRDLTELIAAHGGQLPRWLAEQNPLHPITKIAFSEQLQRMGRAQVDADGAALVRVSRQQSYVVRKAILEKVRARAGMGGYVITGLRDNPLSSSAIFDDFGRAKYPPDAMQQINADSVLLLGRGRARVWSHDGDRPSPFEPTCFAAGQATVLDITLAHAGAPLPGGTLTWRIAAAEGALITEGAERVAGPLMGGAPRSLARFTFDAPPTDRALALTLETALETGAQTIRNRWPLWVFPVVSAWPEGIAVLGPAGSLTDQRADLWEVAARVETPPPGARVLITSTVTPAVLDYLRGGGAALIWQNGDRPLPAVTGPFWRGGTKLIADHPVLAALAHAGFVDLQFYGVATPWALDPARLAEALPGLTEVRPLLRRLDNHLFTVSDYLIAARLGAGRLFATTLRFQGGLGDQPNGLRFNLAGRWLLSRILHELLE